MKQKIKDIDPKDYETIRNKLIDTARKKICITYSEVGSLINLDMNESLDRNKLAYIIGEISKAEHNEGRPMLSALVVHKDNKICGVGFFKLAKELGLHTYKEDIEFLGKECKKLYEYWSKN